MERPKNIKQARQLVKLIIIFHMVGLAGLLVPISKPLFLQLVPYHLWLMAVIIILSHQPKNSRFALFVFIIAAAGFASEWLGSNTALLFGNYQYGNTLGFKLGNVPITMAINWFLLIYSTGALMQRSQLKSALLRIASGAAILVLLDILVEPVAMRLDYWHWQNSHIPITNYVCWFLFSGLLLFVFERFGFKRQGMVAPVLLITQFLFFGLLNIFLNHG